jgi:putative transposase
MSVAPLQFLLHVFAGWVNRRQVEILEYLQEENRVLREQLGDRRLRFTDAQRRRLAVKGRVLGRRVLQQLAGLVTPNTILRWHRELIAKKYDGTAQRKGSGRGTTASLQRLVVRFATESPSAADYSRRIFIVYV